MDVKQVGNVLALLEYFAQQQKPATLADIAKHFGWPRSSTFNLLSTLAAKGYLYEPRAREGYYPSTTWRQLVNKIDEAAPVPPPLQAMLQRLSERTLETAVLAGISGANALFLATVESPHAVRYTANVGKRVPLHITATGRALLSLLSETDRAALLRKAVFERYTPATLMSVEAVEMDIARSIARGWFEGMGEYSHDLGGVALPLEYAGRQLAVLIGGPTVRVQAQLATIAGSMREELKNLAPKNTV